MHCVSSVACLLGETPRRPWSTRPHGGRERFRPFVTSYRGASDNSRSRAATRSPGALDVAALRPRRDLVSVAVCLQLRAEVGVGVVLLTPSLSQDGVSLSCIRAGGVLVGPVRLGEVPACQIPQGAGDLAAFRSPSRRGCTCPGRPARDEADAKVGGPCRDACSAPAVPLPSCHRNPRRGRGTGMACDWRARTAPSSPADHDNYLRHTGMVPRV